MIELSLGFSPCPNDTFVFHALVHGIVEVPGVRFTPRLEDVETLNQLTRDRELDIAKISYGALVHVLDEYTLLRSGGAMGRGCGPLIVARRPLEPDQISRARIAIPGRFTTANLLLRLFAPDAAPGVELRYDRIMPAVAAGEFDAGLIIHESRFTYPAHGLTAAVDLGEWWERETGAPIPLGAIVARRSLGGRVREVEAAIRESVEHAFAHRHDSAAYVRAHAQELSDDVTRSHIDLYVNQHTADIGADGERAVRELIDRATVAGLLPRGGRDPLAELSTI